MILQLISKIFEIIIGGHNRKNKKNGKENYQSLAMARPAQLCAGR
jgi:hypothetical protein